MRTSRRQLVTINSIDGLLESFFTGVPPDYHFETTRLQIYPIDYFRPFLRIPTPPGRASFSFLLLQRKGRGVVQINADLITMRSRGAMFVTRGSIVSLRSLHPSTSGWMIMYDDAVAARVLHPRTVERIAGLRSSIPLSADTAGWAEELCMLLAKQTAIEATAHQPVCDHLFGALVERVLAENAPASPRRVDRAESLDRQFRRLAFDNAVAEGSVGFYAERLNVSENYLLRCVSKSSGRSPKEWIIDVRLMHAQKLLRTTDATVAEIAAQSGFDDSSYFGRLFRRRFGMSPRSFRTIPGQDLSE